MRWRTGRRSTNIEDRRGRRVARGRGIKLGGGVGIIAVVVVLLMGGDPGMILSMLEQSGGPASPTSYETSTPQDEEQAQFVSVVLADTEDTWSAIFERGGARYQPPALVLYTDTTNTGCGGSAVSGPFYCPGDRKVYLDLGFFNELRRLGATGDFARAYVIGHEVAHHVQNLIGTMDEVNAARAGAGRTGANQLSVMLELQADCYAGVWAHHADKARNILEAGDVDEGLRAAAAIGDDRLQRMAGRSVQPDAFTHGSSEQRVAWFQAGLESGDLAACDTFSG